MINCNFCGLRTDRPKFCSIKCIKRNWYKIRHPDSYFNHSKKFWISETGIGFKWEKYAAKKLGAIHLEFSKGVDLNWNGRTVDVKVSNLYKRKNKRGAPVKSPQKGVWVFQRNKPKNVDFFFCISLFENKPIKTLLIPGNKFPSTGLVIGWKSKYDEYKY